MEVPEGISYILAPLLVVVTFSALLFVLSAMITNLRMPKGLKETLKEKVSNFRT